MPSPAVILVVDDMPLMRLLLSRACTTACPHAVILAAGTVADALTILEQHLVTVLITDHNLPDGTGLDIVRAARAEDAALPVIVVSADASIAVPAAAAGATAFFAKPFDLTAFVSVLQRFC